MSKKLLIPIIAVVVVAVVGVVLYMFVFSSSEPKIVPTNYVPGDVFTTNASDSNTLIRVGIVLVLNTDDSKLQETLTEQQGLVRETIYRVLRSKSKEELAAQDIFDVLETEMVSALNARFAEYEIDNFYGVVFSDYVIQ